MGNYEIVEYLLKLENGFKWDINVTNFDMKTALHKAAFNGHSSIVLLLLENGADPWLNDNNLDQPINLASNKKTYLLL